MRTRKAFTIAILALLLLAPWSHSAQDPAADFQRALQLAERGEHSLARGLLDPVVISPRINATFRAGAYFYRGLLHYLDGHWVSARQDYQRALEFDPLQRHAQSALAWLYLHGLGTPRRPHEAIRLYQLAAGAGHQEAQFNLGLILLSEVDGADPVRALYWFEQAAKAGHAEARVQAGQLLARGHSEALSAQPERARHWLEPAARDGHQAARLQLGLLLRQDPEQREHAEHWLLAAARDGDRHAQTHLGHLYLEQEAHDQALTWFREAGKHGDATAQAYLGFLYQSGLGTTADPDRAYRWYHRAALQDHANAQFNLARLYASGAGGLTSSRKARYWLERAATADHPAAREALDGQARTATAGSP